MNTIDEIVTDLQARLAPEDQKWLIEHTLEDAEGLHHTFGMWIRNHYLLWHTHPLTERWRTDPASHDMRGGVDWSEDHPDAVSTKIIEALWRKLRP